jgi:hypothetical protein
VKEIARHATCIEKERGRNAYRMLVGKLEGKKQLVRSRRRRGDINTDFEEIGQTGVQWIDLAQDRGQCWIPVNAITNLRVPQNAENNFTLRETVDFSSRTLLRVVS